MWAAYKGRTDVAHLLLEKGANPNITGQVLRPDTLRRSRHAQHTPLPLLDRKLSVISGSLHGTARFILTRAHMMCLTVIGPGEFK